ncbi:hypothetical protein O0L34_g11566 [Tuta absoluta]|nr:hypothetical protein O0L34_g11566 [Tuta absoluta]
MFFESFWLNFVVASGLIIALTFDYVTKFFSYWYVRHIPYKTSVPFFGSDYHRVLGVRNTTEEVNTLYQQHPKEDFVGSVKSRIPDLVVRNPDLIKEVLCTEFKSFKSRGLDLDKSRDICIRNNLFYAEGEKWTLLRERLESLLNDVTVPEERILKSLSGTNGSINVQHSLTKVLDTVYESLFLQDSNRPVITDLRKVLQRRNLLDKYFDYLKNIFPSVYVSFGFSSLSKPSKKLIEEVNESKFCNKVKSTFDFNDKSLSKKIGENPGEVTYELLSSIVSEGYMPSLNLLTALLYELAKNLQIQKKARESPDDYLDAVIKETLRLHPPVSVITRQCTKTYKFSQSKILIDRKVTVNIPVEAIQNDEGYFKEAEKFIPERFFDGANINSSAYLPFGAGPRKCVGEQMALNTVRSIARTIIKNYQIEPTEKTPNRLPKADHNFGRVVDMELWLKFQPIS